MQTKDYMDVEQDTPGSDKLLRWPLRKKKEKKKINFIHVCAQLPITLNPVLHYMKLENLKTNILVILKASITNVCCDSVYV